MLPSIGVHIDFTQCCGELTGVGISHELNVNVTECCDMDQQAACQESSEITQPPVYNNLSVSEAFQVPAAHIVLFSSFVFDNKPPISLKTNELEENSALPKKQILSLFQVFLC